MKRTNLFIIILLTITCLAKAQAQLEWASPFVGYTNIDKLTVDKVELLKNKTLMDVTVEADSGYTFWISGDAYLSSEGKRYALKKVTPIGIDKRHTMSKSDKVHFTMQFEPLPTNTKRFHFVEGKSETGWRLCNICQNKEVLATEMPREWQNVEYADVKELPESRLCDDSTTINVKILNYVPEAGKHLSIFFTPFDGDFNEDIVHAAISDGGTATLKLHPCFPQTVQMFLRGGEAFPLLVMPGDTVSVLMDLARGGSNPTFAFKGRMAKVNYELNVKAEACRKPFDVGSAYFESLLKPGLHVESELMRQYTEALQKVEDAFSKKEVCYSTKEWLVLDRNHELALLMTACSDYLNSKLKRELKSVGSTIIQNKSIIPTVRIFSDNNISWPYREISSSKKMTWCPLLSGVLDRAFSNPQGKVNTYNHDIYSLRSALQWNQLFSAVGGQKRADNISDPDLKAFYFVAAKRWNAFVDSINSIPHLHLNQHQGLRGDELRRAFLDDYKGKSVVFLYYSSTEEEVAKILQQLEPMMAKADSDKVVFIHFDRLWRGIRNWANHALAYHGEHYGGYRNDYHTLFPQYQQWQPKRDMLFELYTPDGTQTLSTDDAKEAIKAIEKLVEE